MSDEQRVRTMAGWIGVEISRSRVRTPGKAGWGLYRVRGSVAHRTPAELAGLIEGAVTADGAAERGPWTPYAFRLDAIEANVRWAIAHGTPAAPGVWHLVEDIDRPAIDGKWTQHVVPTRWSSAYTGRRDLGVRETPGERAERLGRREGVGGRPVGLPECGCPNRRDHSEPALHLCRRCGFEGGYESVHEQCAGCTPTADRERKAGNATFQAEHLKRREAGLVARYATKRARGNAAGGNG